MLADAWPRALPAVAPNALVVADALAAALLAPAPDVLVLAEAPAPALPAHAPDASGRTDARAPALLAPLPLALLNALSFACMQMPGSGWLFLLDSIFEICPAFYTLHNQAAPAHTR